MSEEQITIAKMQKDIDYLKEKMDGIDSTLKEFIDRADSKYAPKWVADAFKVILYVVATGFLGTAVTLFIKYGHLVL